MCLNIVIVSLPSLIFQINKLSFSSLSHISDFLALSGAFSTVLCLSWHTVPQRVTTLQPRHWERKDAVEELFQIGPPEWIWLISQGSVGLGEWGWHNHSKIFKFSWHFLNFCFFTTFVEVLALFENQSLQMHISSII